jgi:lipoate-protein ligase B
MREPEMTLMRLGLREYLPSWEWQQKAAADLRDRRAGEVVVLVQHPPVYTLGRRTRPEHLLLSTDALQSLGASVVEVDRGGDVTFHGPGQLVVYPILDLAARQIGPLDYVRALESVLITALGSFGVEAERRPGVPGAWVAGSNAKIAAVGVRIQGGVSTHGVAINVSTDLSWFSYVVPCGLRAAAVTSMQRVLGVAPPMPAVEQAVIEAFQACFGVTLRESRATVGAL